VVQHRAALDETPPPQIARIAATEIASSTNEVRTEIRTSEIATSTRADQVGHVERTWTPETPLDTPSRVSRSAP